MLAGVTAAEAQGIPSSTVGAAVGISSYDLSGTGTQSILALRATRLVAGRWLLGDLNIASFRPTLQSGRAVTYIFPEVQLQVQSPTVFSPYAGAGVGLGYASGVGVASSGTITASAAVGARYYGLPNGLALGAELRVRGIGTGFSGSMADGMIGLTWSLR